MAHDVVNAGSLKMDKTISVLKEELASMKAGRANPQILDRISIDYYGAPTPLKQIANISAPEPRLLVISPWDISMLREIAKEIQKSDLGINPIIDEKIIRLLIPELTEERRKSLVKVSHSLGEEAKVAIRSVRRDINDQLKKLEKASQITEDDLSSNEKDVQKLTDKHIETIDAMIKAKEKELLEV